jgi:hypothetical protein
MSQVWAKPTPSSTPSSTPSHRLLPLASTDQFGWLRSGWILWFVVDRCRTKQLMDVNGLYKPVTVFEEGTRSKMNTAMLVTRTHQSNSFSRFLHGFDPVKNCHISAELPWTTAGSEKLEPPTIADIRVPTTIPENKKSWRSVRRQLPPPKKKRSVVVAHNEFVLDRLGRPKGQGSEVYMTWHDLCIHFLRKLDAFSWYKADVLWCKLGLWWYIG